MLRSDLASVAVLTDDTHRRHDPNPEVSDAGISADTAADRLRLPVVPGAGARLHTSDIDGNREA